MMDGSDIESNLPPRYTTRLFPAYRFVPGQKPHPRRDPAGHSYGLPEPQPDWATLAPEKWRDCELYLYGIDLYNHGYWWECHEELEAIWHRVQSNHVQSEFLKGIIQIAAANLRRFMNSQVQSETPGASLATKALEHLEIVPATYMGVDVDQFRDDVLWYFGGKSDTPAIIRLQFD
ncbi:MAG TPA: DUF309 domain-containing protein [candidate division Zixibacteria bacterium]|jgi:predicted metal-dependent hydrolase